MHIISRFVLALSLVVCSCGGAEPPYVWVESLPPEPARVTTIAPQDRIFVLVRGQAAMSGEQVVRADGSIVHALIGKVDVAGLTESAAADRLRERLRGILEQPQVSVAIVASSPAKVSVIGEVEHPGRFDVDDGEGVLGALARAGGLTEFADRDGIFVLREVPQPMRIRFRYEGLTGGGRAARFRLRNGDTVVVE
jgi:polysaccharide export outer membrane protein